jgi:hypothetical protein
MPLSDQVFVTWCQGWGGLRVLRLGVVGSPAEVVGKIGAFAEVGVETLYLQVLDLADLDHLADIAAEVMPQV